MGALYFHVVQVGGSKTSKEKEMKHFCAIVLILLLSGFMPGTAGKKKIFKQLYALEGVWRMQTKQGAIHEVWRKVNKRHLRSTGFFVKGKDTIVTERVSLQNLEKGIFYTSTVEEQNNRRPVSFKLTSSNDSVFIFENPLHDFPRRIVYKLAGKDSLHAYIDDGTAGAAKRQHFYYSRVIPTMH
jgi:Domain of unknown function (DUF6265)